MKKYNLEEFEVLGSGVVAIYNGMGNFKSSAQQLINECQIGEQDDKGNYILSEEVWYPLVKGIELNQKFLEKIGPNTMKNIGSKLPETAIFPPHINDIYSAIESVNIAYHMNHRKNGEVMFDIQTGKKLSGIGYYGYEKVEGQNKIISVCENPYPSYVDEGILIGIAKKFQPKASITLDTTKPTRRNGGDSDTFIITW